MDSVQVRPSSCAACVQQRKPYAVWEGASGEHRATTASSHSASRHIRLVRSNLGGIHGVPKVHFKGRQGDHYIMVRFPPCLFCFVAPPSPLPEHIPARRGADLRIEPGCR